MLSTRYFVFIVIAIAASVESRTTSSFRSNDAFLRGMLTPDSQYMYISACRSSERVECIARGGSEETEHQGRRRHISNSEDLTPMQVVGKARNAAATFAVKIQRHAFTQIPRQRVEDNKNGIN
jgi:hypothetical protein